MLFKILFSAFGLCLVGASAFQTVIPVVQDKYQSSLTQNGKSQFLKVGEESDQKSWMIFPKEFLPNNNYTQAFLGLYVSSISAGGDLEIKLFEVDPISDPETNLTLNPGDISETEVISQKLVSDDEGSFKLIDITTLMKSGSFTNYIGIVLESGGSLSANFDSREGARAPMLMLIVEESEVTLPTWVENSGEAQGDISGTFPNLSIVDGAVSEAKLADNAVTENKIADNSISSGKIQANSVTSAKLAGGSVDSSHIKNGNVFGSKIADNAVTVSKIANGSVSNSKIATGAVREDNIATNVVSSTKIKSASILDSHIVSIDYSKINNTAHTHDNEDLTPNSISTNIFSMSDPNLGTFNMKMMVWEFTIPSASLSGQNITNIELDGSSSLLPCPNPAGILFMTGTLKQGDKYIPLGVLGNNSSSNERWEVTYSESSGVDNDILTLVYNSAVALNPVKIVCFFIPSNN